MFKIFDDEMRKYFYSNKYCFLCNAVKAETVIMRFFSRLIFLLFFAFTLQISAQQRVADSLEVMMPSLEGEEKVDVFNQLSDIYQYIDYEKAIDYAKKGIELASKIGYKKGLAWAYGSLGFAYTNIDNKKAVKFTKKALEIRQRIGDKAGIATSTNVLAVIRYYESDYLASIEYHLKAMKMREEIGDQNKIAVSYNAIALVHLALEDYETAREYLDKALVIRENQGYKTGIGIIKANIGEIYYRTGDYKNAHLYFTEALRVNEEIGNVKSVANTLVNLGRTEFKLSDFDEALKYYRRAEKIYVELVEKHGLSQAQNGIALIHQENGDINRAIENALSALENARAVNSLDISSISADILQSAYEEKGDYKNAFKYLSVYKEVSEELKVTEKLKKLARLEFDYKLNKVKEEQKAALVRQEKYIQYLMITLTLSLVIVALIIAGYVNKRRTNKKLNNLNSRLEELNASKDRFFSIIAHDLRGPFQTILGYSEALTSQIAYLEKEEIHEFSVNLYASLQKQYELLNDLLHWSQLQNGNFELQSEPILLCEEVDKVIEAIEFTAQHKEIKIANEIEKDLIVLADKNMLHLVLRNLISNGLKFSNQGGTVKIRSHKKEKTAEISVVDNGIGIHKKDIEKLFRIDIHHSTRGTKNERGTGLGLILSKEIIEKHSGQIRVESKPDQGSNFTFSIPSTES